MKEHPDYMKFKDLRGTQREAAWEILECPKVYKPFLRERQIDPTEMARLFVEREKGKDQQYQKAHAHLRESDMTRRPACSAIDFDILEQEYQEGRVLRTLTCLREAGNIDLYYFNDVDDRYNQSAWAFLAGLPDLEKSHLTGEVEEQLRR